MFEVLTYPERGQSVCPQTPIGDCGERPEVAGESAGADRDDAAVECVSALMSGGVPMIERSDLLGSTLVRCAPRRNRHRAARTLGLDLFGGLGLALIGVAVAVLLFVW